MGTEAARNSSCEILGKELWAAQPGLGWSLYDDMYFLEFQQNSKIKVSTSNILVLLPFFLFEGEKKRRRLQKGRKQLWYSPPFRCNIGRKICSFTAWWIRSSEHHNLNTNFATSSHTAPPPPPLEWPVVSQKATCCPSHAWVGQAVQQNPKWQRWCEDLAPPASGICSSPS